MENYKKTTYIILACLLVLTIMIILIIHIFNNTPESGIEKELTTTKLRYPGN